MSDCGDCDCGDCDCGDCGDCGDCDCGNSGDCECGGCCGEDGCCEGCECCDCCSDGNFFLSNCMMHFCLNCEPVSTDDHDDCTCCCNNKANKKKKEENNSEEANYELQPIVEQPKFLAQTEMNGHLTDSNFITEQPKLYSSHIEQHQLGLEGQVDGSDMQKILEGTGLDSSHASRTSQS